MKHILSVILAAVVAIAVSAAGKEAAGIQFTTTSHDFGTIAEKGGPVKCEFEFTNTGNSPLVIISCSAGCGCTRPVFPTEPIRPGKKGVIKVTFLPEGHPGEINKTVKVRTNAPGNKKVVLKLSGNVIPAKAKKK